MFHTLYSKLAAVLLGLFALVGGVSIYGTLRFVELYHEESQQRLNFTLARHLAEQGHIEGVDQALRERLRALFDMQMIVNPNIEIYLLDAGGNLLAYSAPSSVVLQNRVSLEPIKRLLTGAEELPVHGDDPRVPGAPRVFSVAPIPLQGLPQGYLYVTLKGDTQGSLSNVFRDSHVFKLAAGMVLLILVVAFLAGLMVFSSMTRRLGRLAHAMDEFKRSDFSARPIVHTQAKNEAGDEIDQLAANFRDLATRMSAQLHQLTQTDGLRRELVANVSHDLKTPLATLQGYVDTLLLKDDRLSQQERMTYLQIASRSCERLAKLVADLIELAKLDAYEVTLQVEAFSPAELLQDIVQKFQLKARDRRISLQIDLPERAPYVSADIGLIERVLENLIGNALVHTNPEGTVRVGLEARADDVLIRVADTGVGIPSDEVPHIFERFYRITNGERSSGEHAGLGLAITKSILDLHGARMQVDSKVGVGTTFSFSLSRAELTPVSPG